MVLSTFQSLFFTMVELKPSAALKVAQTKVVKDL